MGDKAGTPVHPAVLITIGIGLPQGDKAGTAPHPAGGNKQELEGDRAGTPPHPAVVITISVDVPDGSCTTVGGARGATGASG